MDEQSTTKSQKPIKNGWVIFWLILIFPYGLYLMWAKTKWSDKTKWIITGVFALLVLINSVGNKNSTSSSSTSSQVTQDQSTISKTAVPAKVVLTNTPGPTSPPTPTPTPVPTDANGFPEDYQNVTVADLSKEPSNYNGKTVVFTCTAISFPKDSSGNAAAINCSDPNDYSSILQIDASAFDLTKINAEDAIVVYGVGEGSSTGQNAYGASVSESEVLGMYVNDSTSGYNNTH